MPAPMWKPRPGSGRLERKLRKRELAVAVTKADKQGEIKAAEIWRERRLEVYTRDHGTDRAFGVALIFEGDNVETCAQCHHIVYRSHGGSDETGNLCTLSQKAHRMIHDGELSIQGDADDTLTFTQKDLTTGRIVRTWESPNPSKQEQA